MPEFHHDPSTAWGTRAQIGATVAALDELEGHGSPDLLLKNPLAHRIAQNLARGLSTTDEINRLRAFRTACEAGWGQAVTRVNLERLKAGELFGVQKAIALKRLGRRPEHVTEGFVTASGSVDEVRMEPRGIFWQRFHPTVSAGGTVVVISPGFEQTGRHFYDQIVALNAEGYDAIAMDHQWAGQSDGRAGGVDRGFGVARDLAAVAAFAGSVLRREYGKAGKLILMGNSIGASAGVLSALVLNETGRVRLDGRQMPEGIDAVLQSPFLEPTPSVSNRSMGILARVPVLGRLAVPTLGAGTRDPAGAQQGARTSVLEDTRMQLSAMTRAASDVARVLELVERGHVPRGTIAIVHADRDPVANPKKVEQLATWLGERSILRMIQSRNHLLAQTPAEQGHAIELVRQLVRGGTIGR